MGTTELVLEDDRSSRSDTDFRVLNGERRRVFRINIKYHGSPFRRAQELVGLEPEDCFALATYKIHLAIKKQEAESLPYVFVVVGVPSMTGEQVGQAFPEDLTQLTRLIQLSNVSGKRDVEDDVVRFLLGTKAEETSAIAGFAKRIGEAPWRVLSARRADLLLRKLLFDRVYAVRVRGFARNYRNAELDMHFSLKQDLTPLEEFLVLLKEHGLHGLSVRLERGSV